MYREYLTINSCIYRSVNRPIGVESFSIGPRRRRGITLHVHPGERAQTPVISAVTAIDGVQIVPLSMTGKHAPASSQRTAVLRVRPCRLSIADARTPKRNVHISECYLHVS